MMNRLLCMAVCAALTAGGCTVKEDRDGCPCLLTIDLSRCHEYEKALSVKGWRGGSSLFGVSAFAGDYPEGLTISVPKGAVSYSVCSPLTSASRLKGMTVHTREGHQCDPLFAYTASVVAEGEAAYDRVVLHKQYTNLHVSLTHPDGSHAGVDSVRVRASCNALSLKDLTPETGKFSCGVSSQDGFFTARVPRQSEGELSLDIIHDGSVLKTIDLGSTLDESGFSWKDEDLDDIWLDFDVGTFDYTLHIEEWKNEFVYDETI